MGNWRFSRRPLIPAVLALALAMPCLAAPDYTRDIAPILAKRCQACHGAAQQMAGLRLDSGAALRKGSGNGPVVIAGESAASKLVERISSDKPGFRMPPVGAPLTAAEIALVKEWIDAGAVVPASEVTSKGEKPAHWAFQPIRRPPVPRAAGARTPIDAFIAAALSKDKLAMSPPADRATLLRRVSLDLTGLLPTPADVRAFLEDKRPDAYERLVDRLLASPHYGEKWARSWLDVAHYADSDGYEKDRERRWAWRWRNWVIDALNRDMPFDQFTIEQLAGDLLPNATIEQRVATGFLRNTLTNREAGVDRMEARFEQIVNRTNSVATGWLGLTAGCAQCHNHKYDPISQREYYQLFAYFDRADEIDIDAPLPGEEEPFRAAWPEYRRQRDAILEKYGVAPLRDQWETKLRDAFRNPGEDPEWDFQVTEFRGAFDGAEKFLRHDPTRRARRDWDRLTDYFLSRNGPDFDRDKEAKERLKEARQEIEKLKLPSYTQAMAMTDDPEAEPTRLRVGGDYRTFGPVVDPGTPAILGKTAAATRLDLARWLVSKDNPLTARVAVNRMWQEFFGRGLVRTPEDFGTQGERPTHPELLDWLAADFMENGWRQKRMHKLIVMSAAYRQSSAARKDLDDPANDRLARQSRVRLPAELIRDAALAAAGLLNVSKIGGPSIKPPQPAGVSELSYAGSVKWKETEGPDRYRRGLYVHYQRTSPHPQLSNFDAPEATVTCMRRRSSNTPLQALNLLNDPVFYEAAEALGQRMDAEGGATPEEKIRHGFLLALSRPPDATEMARLKAFYTQSSDWTAVARVLLNLDEFITRE
jgi:mono/diheme cytochrome c family protein